MLSRKHIWLGVLLTIIMVIGLIPAVTMGEIKEDFGYIPNALEATVSKVNLETNTEVARYSTVEPRGVSMDLYRVSRLTIDSQGNAWALNTMTGSAAFMNNNTGSVARISGSEISGEVSGVTTSNSSTLVTGDLRVSYHIVGVNGDAPRTIIATDEGGEIYLWIGFYGGNYFEKYHFDGTTLVPVSDSKIQFSNYTPYSAALDENGIMWVVSRNASPYGVTGTKGVFSFDTNNVSAGIRSHGFDIPNSSDDNPYYILVANDDRVWVSDGSDWSTSKPRYFAVYTEGGPVTVEYIPCGTHQAMRGFYQDDNDIIWATSINGDVIKIWWDGDSWKNATIFTGLGELAGIGSDGSGMLWVVRHGLDDIWGFDPANLDAGPVIIRVGNGPYAYGDFVVPEPELYKLCGYKLDNNTGMGLEGWEITLEKLVDEVFVKFEQEGLTNPAITESDGKYCFENLPAGTYRISETIKDNWEQTFPVGDGKYIVTLPNDGNLISNGDFELGNMGFGSEYSFVDPSSPKAINPYTTYMGAEETYTIGTDPFDHHDLWTSFSDHTTGTGKMMIVNGADTNLDKVVWSSIASVVPGNDYTFSFWSASSYHLALAEVDVWINGVKQNTFEGPVGTWEEHSLVWNSGTANFAEIEFICNTLVHTGTDFALDDISLTGLGQPSYNFENRQDTFDLCGYKLDADTHVKLPGWTIILTDAEDTTLEVITDENGRYCFENLPAGTYTIKEVLKDGWKQILPNDNDEATINDGYTIVLPEGASDCDAVFGEGDAVFYNFENAKLYDLCGFKYGVNQMDGLDSINSPLAGWTITLTGANDFERTFITDADGKYCFTGLRAGDYTISESYGTMNADGFWKTPDGKYWKPYDPANGSIEVTLPGDELDGSDGPFHNFFNQCYSGETAWMFGNIEHNSLVDLTSNKWGWSQSLGTLSGTTPRDLFSRQIYAGAGQNDLSKGYLVGNVDIYWNGTKVELNYTYEPGVVIPYDPKVFIGNTKLPIFKDKMTNAPGKLIINVDYSKDAFIAIHWDTYVPCGFPNVVTPE